jgi:beta-lactamase superfamily II metal-dependent hydrolase
MGWEIDFMAVGDESKGGDAIALRWGNLFGDRTQQTVVVIDGGYTSCGTDLVEMIRTKYGTDHVDFVISTHPDQDHVTGLEVVLEEMSVGHLLMHQPWKHSVSLGQARSGAFKSMALSEKVQKSLKEASDLEAIATAKAIEITEPFSGVHTQDGVLRIVGPTQTFYEETLASISPQSATMSLATLLREGLAKAKDFIIPETLHHETLRDEGTTSAQNNTSVITLLTFDDGWTTLLTADAGMPALENALDGLEASGWKAGTLSAIQVPHHGSRRNVGPSVLDRLLDPAITDKQHGVAYLSAPAKNPEGKHPSRKVTNAFRRRGYFVYGTQGTAMNHSRNAPSRGTVPITPHPLYTQVEADGDEA